MGEKTIGSGRQGSVFSTYWVNKDECERRSTGQVGRETSSEEVNVAFERATEGVMKGILEYSDVPLVSQDIVGNPASCISDLQLTMSVGENGQGVGLIRQRVGVSSRAVNWVEYIGKRL